MDRPKPKNQAGMQTEQYQELVAMCEKYLDYMGGESGPTSACKIMFDIGRLAMTSVYSEDWYRWILEEC
jgi:hypothetical protein